MKVGDLVVFEGVSKYKLLLTLYKSYEIIEIEDCDSYNCFLIKNDNNNIQWYHENFFISINNFREKKLKKLFNE